MGYFRDVIDGILAAIFICAFAAFAAAAPPDLNYLAAREAAISHDRVLVVFVGIASERVGDCEAISVDALPGYAAGDIVVSAPEGGKLWWVASVQDVKSVRVPVKPYFGGAVDALDEVNRQRAQRGLRPFQRDDGLTFAAKAAATFRAANRIQGHTSNDFSYLPPGSSATTAGCCAWESGFGACAMFDGYQYAGAACVRGADGRNYCHVFYR